jgi:hypothetical protein
LTGPDCSLVSILEAAHEPTTIFRCTANDVFFPGGLQ